MGLLGDLSPQGSIAVGVLVGLVSTSLQAIGLTLQRKSHLLEDEKRPFDLRRPPYKRRRWQVGMFMFVISNIVGSTIQITTLPLPVLSTLQASGLVFNTVFATLILGEPFTRYSLAGTVFVCIGAVLIAIFGAIGEPAHTLDQLLQLLCRGPFIAWMICTGILVVATILGSRLIKFLATPNRSRSSLFTWIPFLRAVPRSALPPSRVKLLRGMSYGFVSGVLSAHSLLVAKSAVELLVRTVVDHVNQFNRWQSWVILLAMIALALTQLYYMHRGLKLCSTSVLYPFVFCIYNIIAILDGLIYFHQASQLLAWHAGLIAVGTVILLAGVLMLSWRLDDTTTGHGQAVPPAQSGLTPGMGMIEESAGSPRTSGFFPSIDEEAQPGEQQPLLDPTRRKTEPPQKRGSTYLRGPDSPTHTREAAQIWAELDDDDDQIEPSRSDLIASVPSGNSPQSVRRHRRNRSTTNSSFFVASEWRMRPSFSSEDGAQASPGLPNGTGKTAPGTGTWGTRRLRLSTQGLRHSSAPHHSRNPPLSARRRTLYDSPLNISTSTNHVGERGGGVEGDRRGEEAEGDAQNSNAARRRGSGSRNRAMGWPALLFRRLGRWRTNSSTPKSDEEADTRQ